jgi:general secretion pathway protein K
VIAARAPRRGVALLGALWLVAMIASVSAHFAVTVRERRALGLVAADGARDHAVLAGALATVHAQLEAELRAPLRTMRGAPSLSDPWHDLDARLAGGVTVGDVPVAVHVLDLGAVANVNRASEFELQSLIAAVLRDAQAGRELAQAILDWRDPDTLPRALGGEAAAYAAAGLLVPPENANLREVDDLRHVIGMTPERLEALRPYLTTAGSASRVNLNTAPEPVLRTLPGMTEPLLAQILALRAGGRRIESVPALVAASGSAGRGSDASDGATRRFSEQTTLETRDVLVELSVRDPFPGPPARLRVVVQRTTDGLVRVGAKQW